MLNFKCTSLFSIFSLLLLQILSPPSLSQNQLTFGTISHGGERHSSKSYIVTGNLGQTNIDQSNSTSYLVKAGFWQMFYQDVILDVENDEMLPREYKLEQNYPNPFNPSTTIQFSLPERGNVLIKVYDILGREVITLVNREMEAGWHKITFNAARYSSGAYICRMQVGNKIFIKKMMMIK